MSLVNQFYRSKSTLPERPEQSKVYFTKNQVLNFVKQGKAHLIQAIKLYNALINKKKVQNNEVQIPELLRKNKKVNKLFSQACSIDSFTSGLMELDL